MYKRFSGGKIQTSHIRNNIFTQKGKIKGKSKEYTSKNTSRISKDKEFSKEYIEQLIQRYYELDEELSPKK